MGNTTNSQPRSSTYQIAHVLQYITDKFWFLDDVERWDGEWGGRHETKMMKSEDRGINTKEKNEQARRMMAGWDTQSRGENKNTTQLGSRGADLFFFVFSYNRLLPTVGGDETETDPPSVHLSKLYKWVEVEHDMFGALSGSGKIALITPDSTIEAKRRTRIPPNTGMDLSKPKALANSALASANIRICAVNTNQSQSIHFTQHNTNNKTNPTHNVLFRLRPEPHPKRA